MRQTVTVLGGILLVLLFLFSNTIITAGDNKDDVYQRKIIGSWSEGESPYGISTFKSGGVYEAEGFESPQKKQRLFKAEGKWWIKDGKLYNTVHKVEPPIIPTNGKVYIDIIVDITDDTMTLIDDEGRQYTNTRVK